MRLTFDTFKKTFSLFIPHILKDKSSKQRCCLAFIIILVDIAASSVVPYFSKQVVDSLSINILASVSVSVLLLGMFWSLEKITSHIQEIIFFPVINNTIRNVTFDVVEHIHRIPLANYQKISVPELINCMRRISMSARAFIKIFILMIVPTIFKLGIATFVAIQLGLFGWGLLFSLPIALIIVYQGTKWYVATREESWQATDLVVTRINDSILNTKTTRFFKQYEMSDVGALLNKEATLWHKTNTRLYTIPIILTLLLGTTITVILYFAVRGIYHQTLTIGDFVMLKGQLIAAFLPLKTFSVEFRQLVESLIDIKKVTQIFDIPTQKKLDFSIAPLPTSKAILFNNVTFSHENDPALFSDFTYTFNENEKILIMGDSGGGKSSLLNLMNGLYSPKKGNIWVCGREISCLSNEALSNLICFIPQDFRLFNKTIRYNLTYGIPSLSEEIIKEATYLTGLNELISQMPNGLETVVGEMGTRLSGGEQQMVALTRALLLKPKILLLDETTHSLNKNKEEKILKALFKVISTVIIVSHRTVTLPEVTHVLVLEHGELKSPRHARYTRIGDPLFQSG